MSRYFGKKDQKNIPALAPVCAACRSGVKKISLIFKRSRLAVLLCPSYRRACDTFHVLKKSRKGQVILMLLAAFFITGGIFVLAELGGYGLNGPATSPNSLDYKLIGYWDMEEGSGQSVKDKSGNGNDGVLGDTTAIESNDPVFSSGHDSGGLNGSGLGFDGVDDRVDLGNGNGLDVATGLSISAWVLPISQRYDNEIISRTGGTPTQGFGLYYGYGSYFLFMTTENTAWREFYAPDSSLTLGSWQHIVVTYDNSSTAKIYINGVLVTTDTTSWSGKILNGASVDAYLGASGWGDGEGRKTLDEIRVYDRAITADEARLLYNQKKPVLEMKFDEGSGTMAYDESFNGNDGTLGGDGLGTDLPTWTTGKNNGGLSFDGDDYIAGAGINSTTFTAEGWVKVASHTGAARPIVEYSPPGSNLRYGIAIGSTNTPRITYGSSYVPATGSAMTIDEWHHIVGTWDGTTSQIYMDGVLLPLGTAGGATCDTADILRVGRSANTQTLFFSGLIDEVRIYNYVRTTDEVLADYNDGLAAHLGENNQDLNRGLVGYWDMEEGNGQAIEDKTGNSNDGTLGASSAVGSDDPSFGPGHDASGENSTGLAFDGTDDYVDAGTGSSLDITGAITLAGWVKIDDLTKSGCLFGRGVAFGTNGNFGYYLSYSSSGTIYWDTYSTTNRDYLSYAFSETGWHYLVATWDGTINANGKKLYVDGVLVDQEISTISTIGSTSYNFLIGKGSSPNTFPFPGSIDEVRVYNRAISEDEIRQLYNQKKPVLELKLDEGMGSTAYDESFNDNDGIINGGATWAAGQSGTALSFDGTYNGVFGTPQISADEITVSFFMKDLGTTRDWAIYADLRSDSNNRISMAANDVNTRFIPIVRIAGVNYDAPNVAIPSGFNHYVAVFSKSGNFRKTYLNGVLVDTYADYPGGFIADEFYIGYETISVIDELRVYNYARTADEVLTDYNDGQAAHLGKNNQGLDQGLVGYWDMEEGSGQSVKDKSGNANHGTLGTSSSIDAADPDFVTGHDSSGAVGMGLGFDGGSDFVDAGTGTSLGLTHTGTISLWIKPNSLTQDDFAGFVTKRSNTNGGTAATYSYSFHWRRGDAVLRLALSDGATIIYATAPLFADTNWHHVLGLWDGTNMKIYKDGVLAATPVAQTLDAQAGATFNTVIGGASFSTSASNRGEWNGSIDEVRMYNRALSEDEIHMLYNQKRPVLDMRFDEGFGTTAYDDSFNNNDGTLGGDGSGTDLPVWTQGKFGSALSFDGSDDYIFGGAGSSVNLASALTIEAWVKPDSRDFTTTFAGLVNAIAGNGDNSATYVNYELQISNATQISFLKRNPSENLSWFVFDAPSSMLNNWHHVAAIYDGTNISIVLDGHSLGSQPVSGGLDSSNNGGLMIGRYNDQSPTCFDGLIDNFRMYNYARTQAEVLTDYNGGLAAHLR